jgi:hypothetical protein
MARSPQVERHAGGGPPRSAGVEPARVCAPGPRAPGGGLRPRRPARGALGALGAPTSITAGETPPDSGDGSEDGSAAPPPLPAASAPARGDIERASVARGASGERSGDVRGGAAPSARGAPLGEPPAMPAPAAPIAVRRSGCGCGDAGEKTGGASAAVSATPVAGAGVASERGSAPAARGGGAARR